MSTKNSVSLKFRQRNVMTNTLILDMMGYIKSSGVAGHRRMPSIEGISD